MKSRKLPFGYKMIGISLMLLSLVMFSTWLTSGLYAKYVVDENADDGARVAAFATLTLTETTGTDYKIIPGVDITKNPHLSVKGSETACYVFLTVDKGDAWEIELNEFDVNTGRKYVLKNSNDKVYWLISGSWTYLYEDSKKSVYYRTLEPGYSISSNSIISGNKISVSEDLLNSELKNLPSDIKLTFEAYAVQYGDFGGDDETENAIAAYESVINH